MFYMFYALSPQLNNQLIIKEIITKTPKAQNLDIWMNWPYMRELYTHWFLFFDNMFLRFRIGVNKKSAEARKKLDFFSFVCLFVVYRPTREFFLLFLHHSKQKSFVIRYWTITIVHNNKNFNLIPLKETGYFFYLETLNPQKQYSVRWQICDLLKHTYSMLLFCSFLQYKIINYTGTCPLKTK